MTSLAGEQAFGRVAVDLTGGGSCARLNADRLQIPVSSSAAMQRLRRGGKWSVGRGWPNARLCSPGREVRLQLQEYSRLGGNTARYVTTLRSDVSF